MALAEMCASAPPGRPIEMMRIETGMIVVKRGLPSERAFISGQRVRPRHHRTEMR
jgi:hypothetical protein